MKTALHLLFLLLGPWAFAQTVTGIITNEFGEPVPYANVLVQETGQGTMSDDVGAYALRFETEGTYRLVFSSLGYENRKETVVLAVEVKTLDVRLNTALLDLEEITIKATAKDPAYGIIKKVVANKALHLRSAPTYRTKVYVKAVEAIERTPRKTAPVAEEEQEGPPDPFAEEARKNRELLGRLNLVEMELILNFQYPRQYKEERIAYQAAGQTQGLFIPRFGETDFNFYRNTVSLTGISDAVVISPLSTTGVLSYKYQLESTDLEGQQIVYKIRVTPRKKGNSTCEGWLYINEGSWTINRLDLTFSKYALKFFDDFRLEQDYVRHQDSLWIVRRQAFHYVARQGNKATFTGTTTLSYTDYEHNYPFPERFFGNEVAVTTREAYQRDSSYWRSSRTVALTAEEARLVTLRDSLKAITESQAYQDSIQERYNRVSLLELAWEGVGLRNNARKSHLYLGSLASLIDFSVVGGWRFGPYVSYHRRYASGTVLNTSGSLNYGVKNNDLQGDFSAWYRYDAFRLADISVSGGRSFESINQYDAYLNQLRPSNYILLNAGRVRHSIELFNGFFLVNEVGLNHRMPITGLATSSFLQDLVEDEEEPQQFEAYTALISTNAIAYTPGLKYMREPDRKIRLGSKWPTFTLLHRKGWDGPLSSDIDFDYLRFSVDQEIVLGTMGTSFYELRLGQFLNTRDLRFVDFQRFRESDPLLFSDPKNSFQALDTSLATTDFHVEFHHIHHFNGALVNNIPLLKKTRIRAVGGGGLLWIPAQQFRYQELFFGVERVFKVGARRRLRVGTYAVLADASNAQPRTAFKVSFDLIDLWKRDWSF
ncbi:DUF5686 and carboxypeptidase regulatory-like domain-containing protein [Neolewinella lacunae]|uniref:Carboxypeptidase-like regulatory domain-containing protein n=1 Tax=Neolewinella lacunae TaxID=1517758 RepID=A0A923PJJ7_9BACT|nr:DUF5686 and carboxypeptidase regulatory-like domain-containing protein [Neolewinella lacunae]MBC6995235.1 carboxypeptidase-like regulatory domain-containing protein [Neolewinella lacunae]MDN3635456.1 DUF5686 and carboxypeptidase regulatory-like domain-containing protein [Neolewinella lacunae]